METVLIIGASGNIGVSAVIGSLRSNRAVIAVIRNESSKQKIIDNIPDASNITFVEADVTAEDGVKPVVEKVKQGALPAFQHVFATLGAMDWTSPIQNLELSAFRHVMNISLEANYLAYRATIPYLIEQGGTPTFTLVTGGAGDLGVAGVTAVAQGALFSLANVACLENIQTNVRFNELYLSCRVDYDKVIDENKYEGRVKASEFGKVYETILKNTDIRACRVSVTSSTEVDEPKHAKKLPEYMRKQETTLSFEGAINTLSS